MPGPRPSRRRSSAVQLRAAHVRPLQGIRLRGDANIGPYNLPLMPALEGAVLTAPRGLKENSRLWESLRADASIGPYGCF